MLDFIQLPQYIFPWLYYGTQSFGHLYSFWPKKYRMRQICCSFRVNPSKGRRRSILAKHLYNVLLKCIGRHWDFEEYIT